MDELLGLLEDDEGVGLDREVLADAERFVRIDLELEIALQGWGEIGEFQRGIPYDAPLHAALGALQEAESPVDLF